MALAIHPTKPVGGGAWLVAPITGTAADGLELEVTESIAVGGLESAVDLLRRLREMGVTVAIDDFGTGYSSLSYLERLPADRLKIDRSFMRSLANGDAGGRIDSGGRVGGGRSRPH